MPRISFQQVVDVRAGFFLSRCSSPLSLSLSLPVACLLWPIPPPHPRGSSIPKNGKLAAEASICAMAACISSRAAPVAFGLLIFAPQLRQSLKLHHHLSCGGWPDAGRGSSFFQAKKRARTPWFACPQGVPRTPSPERWPGTIEINSCPCSRSGFILYQ